MQFRVYDRQTLAYKDGGYVASYSIDDDYLVNNNSKITIVKALNESVAIGDTIALIETSGAFHKGTITSYDNAELVILYKGEKELFNDNMLNPYISAFTEDVKIATRFGLTDVANLLEMYFGRSNDWAKVIPLKVLTDGDVTMDVEDPDTHEITQEVRMLWNWSNTSINVSDWLISLFERYNVSLSWTIDFNIAATIETELDLDGKIVIENGKIKVINNREPQYIVTLSAITDSGNLIKDNVVAQTITYTAKEQPSATVCVLVDKETKEVVLMTTGQNLWNYNVGTPDKCFAFEYGTLMLQDDDTSNISGYIGVEAGQKYVISFDDYDGKARYISFYDKKKKRIGYDIFEYPYTEGSITPQLFLVPEKIVNKDTESIPAYIQICYYKGSSKLQITKGETAKPFSPYDQPAIFYLINDAGVDMVTLDQKDKARVFPVKTSIVEFDQNSEEEDVTEEHIAYETLVPSRFNQAIEIDITSDSKMFDFKNARYGDLYKIINENGTIDSNYTGKKFNSEDKKVTLLFGIGRQNYTDKIQARDRKSKYDIVYYKGNR